MRLSARIIATAAFTVFLMPAFSLWADEAAKPSTGVKDDTSVDSSTAAAADPVASLPDSPMPMASMAAAIPYSRGLDSFTPRVEWFLGYSYLRAVPTMAVGNRLAWLNGGSTSIAFNLNRHLGLVGDFGGFNETRLLLTTGNPPSAAGPYDAVDDGTVFTFLAGPRLSFRHERFTPFVQALFGDIRASEETTCPTCAPSLPSQNAFAMTAGGGLDIRVHRHLAIRVIQAEYLMTRFENLTTGATTAQNDMRLSSGIVFRFGGNPAPRLPELGRLSYSCSVNPSWSVFPGDAIAVSGTALNPDKTAVYTWSVDGGVMTNGSSTATIDTTNLAAGSYTLKGHVSEGAKPDENADCAAPYAVKTIEPPTVGCLANPSSVLSGDPSTITATGVSPQNWPLTYSYSSTSGSVSGSGPTATLSTVGAVLGQAIVTCNVADDKGEKASATTSVMIAAPAAAPLPAISELCSIHFERDARRPSRVDNEAKACLDQIALTLQQSSDAKLAVIGNVSSTEKGGSKLASQRAVNTKAYLVSEKGIDSSRIAVYTGLQDGKTASTILIPAGASFDSAGDTPVN
jgi:opacity protein-like surface antigen